MQVTASPEQVGLDAAALARLDAHFAGYVDDGRLAGWQLVIARNGQVAHSRTYGHADVDGGTPVADDTLWRVYSMTKPVTTVAAMMLWEEGRFELTDEISRWLPEFAEPRVYAGGSLTVPVTVPATEPIRIWHLMTHTAGLTYGFLEVSQVDALYRRAGFDITAFGRGTIEDNCRAWAALPLMFEPGTRWGYSVATDVLGRIVEIISGQPLAEFVADRITGPLGMTDARWWVDEPDRKRLATLYARHPRTGRPFRYDEMDTIAHTPPPHANGGAGMICTAADYHRFLEMLRGEGTLRGNGSNGGNGGDVRILGSRTVRFMARNHLPGGRDLAALNSGGFADTILDGVGFGLGFAVIDDPVPGRTPISAGSYYWGGVASTAFWVDPAEDLTVGFYTQMVPSSTYPIRGQLRQLVYAALR